MTRLAWAKIKDDAIVVAGVGGIALGAIIVVAGVVAVALFPFWLMLSLGTSTVKASLDDCDTTWKIESVVGGDWFCPEEQSND